jgi:hypothetical protein
MDSIVAPRVLVAEFFNAMHRMRDKTVSRGLRTLAGGRLGPTVVGNLIGGVNENRNS